MNDEKGYYSDRNTATKAIIEQMAELNRNIRDLTEAVRQSNDDLPNRISDGVLAALMVHDS